MSYTGAMERRPRVQRRERRSRSWAKSAYHSSRGEHARSGRLSRRLERIPGWIPSFRLRSAIFPRAFTGSRLMARTSGMDSTGAASTLHCGVVPMDPPPHVQQKSRIGRDGGVSFGFLRHAVASAADSHACISRQETDNRRGAGHQLPFLVCSPYTAR